MADLVNKGWLQVPGIRPMGDRTLEEQMRGLEQALSECKGKTILDLGCAEGLIGREFARAGAQHVHGIELLESHLVVARKACREEIKAGKMDFMQANIATYVGSLLMPYPQYDIVLALGIIHKMKDPAVPLVFAARSARDLLCFRAPARATGGRVRSKFSDTEVDVPATMKEAGFREEALIAGARGESVQYWRRIVG